MILTEEELLLLLKIFCLIEKFSVHFLSEVASLQHVNFNLSRHSQGAKNVQQDSERFSRIITSPRYINLNIKCSTISRR